MLSFLKFLPLLLTAVAVVSNAKSNILPVAPVGNVAGVHSILQDENTRLFYQNTSQSSSIIILDVSGPFTIGSSTSLAPRVLVPSQEALLGTPIAACTYDSATVAFYEIHVFFFSDSNVLSEYYYNEPSGTWHGGTSCTACITRSGFVAAPGSQVLYAMENPTDNTIRVGFISAGSPGTLSEAVRSSGGAWSVATLPA